MFWLTNLMLIIYLKMARLVVLAADNMHQQFTSHWIFNHYWFRRYRPSGRILFQPSTKL